MSVRWYVLGGSVALVALIVLVFGVRGTKSSSPPIQIFPDMKLQPKYHAQGENRWFHDRRDMRLPPAGTVAYGGRNYTADAGHPVADPDLLQGDEVFYRGVIKPAPGLDVAAGAAAGGAASLAVGGASARIYVDRIPALQTEANAPRWQQLTPRMLEDGREIFNYTCALCHGLAGNGKGITRQYGMQPANLHDPAIVAQPDGKLYETITNGRGGMKGYGHMIRAADRWAVLAYVRALQRSQRAGAADIPPENHRELGIVP